MTTANNNPRIKSIEKGWGEQSTYFTTDEKNTSSIAFVNEINAGMKNVGPGEILVYNGFKDGKIVFQIEANAQLTITYY